MQHYVQQWMNVYITDSGVLLAVTIRMDAEALCEDGTCMYSVARVGVQQLVMLVDHVPDASPPVFEVLLAWVTVAGGVGASSTKSTSVKTCLKLPIPYN